MSGDIRTPAEGAIAQGRKIPSSVGLAVPSDELQQRTAEVDGLLHP